MRILLAVCCLAALAILGGCSQQEEAATPEPFALTDDAIGRYCGMNVLEHDGPKGQIILSRIPEPIWFSSARDVVAFTHMPDEPKTVAAIYVSDMGAADSWENPGTDNWIDARQAFYVIGSSMRGGMGAAETVPFSTEEAAQDFTSRHGGQIVRFDEIPVSYVLGGGEDTVGSVPPPGHEEH